MDPRYNTYPQRQTPQPQPQVAQRQHQRFSWQAPVETDVAPSAQRLPQYEEVHYPPQQHLVNTNVGYAPTPNTHNESAQYTLSSEDATHPSSPLFTPIDDRPQSRFDMLFNTPGRQQSQRAYAQSSHLQGDETPLSPSSPEAQTLPFMLVESQVGAQSEPTSPQQQQQQQPAPQSPVQQSRHARQMSTLAPLNTTLTQPAMPAIPQSPISPGALPSKTPITPYSNHHTRIDTPNTLTAHPAPAEPYSPHSFPSHALTPSALIFSPDAPHGPNGLSHALHQPGQIRHPNMTPSTPRPWSSSLCTCSDVATCLTGLFCPCILSSRTAYRLRQKSKHADPTDMLGHSGTSAHCVAMTLACGVGLGWLFPMVQRTRIRHLYRLEGSCMGDVVKACCCCCCVAVQNEREVRTREESAMRWAGPAGRDAYERSAGMEYRPQN